MGYETNVVVVSGNLTRDPEVAQVGDSSVCEFGLAWNQRYKKGDEWTERAHFFDVKIWGAQGDRFYEHASKGLHVTVKGRLMQRSWEDKEGNKRSKLEIEAEDIIYDTRTTSAGHKHDEHGSPQDPDGSEDFSDVDFGEDKLPF